VSGVRLVLFKHDATKCPHKDHEDYNSDHSKEYKDSKQCKARLARDELPFIPPSASSSQA
jgi:hypothetical protein